MKEAAKQATSTLIWNENQTIEAADRKAVHEARKRNKALHQHQQAIAHKTRPNKLIDELQQATHQYLSKSVPKFSEQYALIRGQLVGNLEMPPVFPPAPPFDPAPMPDPFPVPVEDPERGHFHWIGSEYWSFGGINCEIPSPSPSPRSGREIKIFGHMHYEEDPLLVGSVGAIENFALKPDRFPNQTATRMIVDTSIQIRGWQSAFTGFYHWLWAADDKWCKCWLVTNLTLYKQLGSALEILTHHELKSPAFELENATPVGHVHGSASWDRGRFLYFDADLQNLAAQNGSLLMQVENRFEIEMEGNADIWFRGGRAAQSEAEPSLENSMRVLTSSVELRNRS